MQVWKFWVSGVATLVTGLPGVLGNGLSLVVLSRRWGTEQSSYPAIWPAFRRVYNGSFYAEFVDSIQDCKQVFMYMNNWDKGVAPAIFPCILNAGEY